MSDAPVARPLRVAVFGAHDASEREYALARELGERLARAGAVVICGGRDGVMAACARGVAEAGGISVGILPGADAGAANPWIVVPLPTGMGSGRNMLVARSAEAAVAVGGSWGTLSEIALARTFGIAVGTLGTPPAQGLGLPALETPEAAASWAVEQARAAREGVGRSRMGHPDIP